MVASPTDMLEQRGQSLLNSLVSKSGDVGLGRIQVVKLIDELVVSETLQGLRGDRRGQSIPEAQVDDNYSALLGVRLLPVVDGFLHLTNCFVNRFKALMSGKPLQLKQGPLIDRQDEGQLLLFAGPPGGQDLIIGAGVRVSEDRRTPVLQLCAQALNDEGLAVAWVSRDDEWRPPSAASRTN